MNFEWLFERPIAHRGLHSDGCPENSIPAFERAIERNLNVEMDVRITKDGHIVVFHDANLNRMCGADRKLADCTLKELKTYNLGGTQCKIPTFEEFLELVDGKVGVLCEIKGLNPLDNTIAKRTLEALENYKGNIALQSFNFGAVIYIRRHSTIPVGQLCTWASKGGGDRSPKANFLGKLHVLRLSRPHFIAYDVKALSPAYPPHKQLKKQSQKLPVLCWTVNSDSKLQDALAYADNVIFEDMPPEVIEAAIFEQRNGK